MSEETLISNSLPDFFRGLQSNDIGLYKDCSVGDLVGFRNDSFAQFPDVRVTFRLHNQLSARLFETATGPPHDVGKLDILRI